MSPNQIDTDLKSTVFYKYHHRTKHTVEKLRSSGYRLDWDSQPNPFLHYVGAPVVELVHDFEVPKLDFFQTMIEMSNEWNSEKLERSEAEPQLSVANFISNLLFYGVAISAWKQVVGTDHRWALRVNASSGNLHPTDTTVLLREDSEGLQAGLYHYGVDEHQLEKRASGDFITPLVQYLSLEFEPPPVVLCLSSTFFREAWKYRDRAFRYCQHDLGHALAALCLSSAALGWASRIVALFPDDEIGRFLGMEGLLEKPMALMLFSPSGNLAFARRPDPGYSLKEAARAPRDAPLRLNFGDGLRRLNLADGPLRSNFADGHDVPVALLNESRGTELPAVSQFQGQPNKLTSNMIEYESIDKVYAATKYDADEYFVARPVASTVELPGPIVACAEPVKIGVDLSPASAACLQSNVSQTIRERRSAVDMDGKTSIDLNHLEFILRAATLGFAADFQGVDAVRGGEWTASKDHLVHLYLYVHRVDGLDSGLYFFNRFEGKLIPLLLRDQKEVAMSTSCFQDIACDGAFSISMIADFKMGFKLYGERCYRLVHYEAGYIGQMLYLAAHALGHDATGIGCFIDDAINNYLGLDEGKEVIYNFTIGKAVLDARLTTLKSYSFL